MLQLPKVIGHRGAAAYAPENTLDSFREAKKRGNDPTCTSVYKYCTVASVTYSCEIECSIVIPKLSCFFISLLESFFASIKLQTTIKDWGEVRWLSIPTITYSKIS